MDKDRKCWNSSLRPVSRGRLAQIYQPGEIVGNFRVIECIDTNPGAGRPRIYKAQCVHCEKEIRILGTLLKKHKSCGCLTRTILKERNTIHGHYYERLYRIWYGMISRCYKKSDCSYQDYGGRGILVCPDWHLYDKFYMWAKRHGYKESLTLDRIDVNGNYEPTNCRWISNRMQATNKRNSHRNDKGDSLSEMVMRGDIKGLRSYGLQLWPRAIKKRAGYKCELCGKDENMVQLDAHHWGATKASNAPTDIWLCNGCCLCRECHMKAHIHVAEYKERIMDLKGGRLTLAKIEINRHKKCTPKELLESIKRIKKELNAKIDAKLKELGI